MTDKLVVKILRSHVQVEASSEYQTYEIPREGITRVLDVLDYIYTNVDPTLAYRRHLCNDGQCLECTPQAGHVGAKIDTCHWADLISCSNSTGLT